MRGRPDLDELSRTTYDVAIVGAGINGAAIARDAARRGLSVVVVDKDDVCSGTSAWSSRLIHGGLRYLEHGELRLVHESLHDRERLLHIAPHLVTPELADARGVRAQRTIVTESGADLTALVDMVAAGAVRVDVAATFPLRDAAEAHRASQSGHVRGKLVLTA